MSQQHVAVAETGSNWSFGTVTSLRNFGTDLEGSMERLGAQQS